MLFYLLIIKQLSNMRACPNMQKCDLIETPVAVVAERQGYAKTMPLKALPGLSALAEAAFSN
jgi:hypothetical protein